MGDGYTSPIHCENCTDDDYLYVEPDSKIIYCKLNGEQDGLERHLD
jgi:hypothetical protein